MRVVLFRVQWSSRSFKQSFFGSAQLADVVILREMERRDHETRLMSLSVSVFYSLVGVWWWWGDMKAANKGAFLLSGVKSGVLLTSR